MLQHLKECGNYKKTIEKARGQLETREYYQTNDIKWLSCKKDWEGLKTIGMVKTTIRKDEKTSGEMRYFISSLETNIELFKKSVCQHWSIESMHWHLDVTFKEDANTTINKNAVMNQNIIRKWSLAILKRCDGLFNKKYSLKAKRFIFSLDPISFCTKALQV